MTCREKLMLEHPEYVDDKYIGGCKGCPSDYGYTNDNSSTGGNIKLDCEKCRACWDQEVDDRKGEGVDGYPPKILDSGNRREFETGAVRDIQEGKGRCDLMPLHIVGDCLDDYTIGRIGDFQDAGDTDYLYEAIRAFSKAYFPNDCTMFLEVAKHFEEGAKKYGEHNWQKGIPVRCYIDSAVRHYLKYKRGDKDEPHDRAFVWNLLCAIWTCENKPELNDYAKKTDK